MSQGLPFITVPLVAWLIAQIYKFALESFRGNIDFKKLYESGGMPSAHTALIVAATTTLGVLVGGTSPLFGFALIITVIIIYDALGVRRSSGLHTEALRELYKGRNPDGVLDLGNARGHSVSEVIAGACVGISVSLVLTYEASLDKLGFLLHAPQSSENLAWLVTTVTVVTLTTLFIPASRRHMRLIRHARLWTLVVLGVIWFAAKTGTPWFGYRLAYVVMLVASLGVLTVVLSRPKSSAEAHKTKPVSPKRRAQKARRKRRR